jgi:ABC-type transport system substrate-binding protein
MKRMALVCSLVLVFSSLSVTEGQDLFELRIICLDTYEFRMEYAQIIANEFAAAGIDVSLDFVSVGELTRRVMESEGRIHEQGGFDVAIISSLKSYATFDVEK